MTSWLGKIRTGAPDVSRQQQQYQTPSSAYSPQTPLTPIRSRDPNVSDYKYQVGSRCIYERQLPGDAYITASVQRLQSGYYDSPSITEDCIHNVRYVAVNFVLHPSRNVNRFRSAEIRIALHNDTDHSNGYHPDNSFMKKTPPAKPRFLRHAPHVLYGSISPETLNWNFNVAGSLGVSQTPVSASLAPSGGMRGSYKMYDMMKIQGSVRTLRHHLGRDYDIEDGEIVWTLEENFLQKSGLPREFTFVMLMSKGEDVNSVALDVEIEPRLGSWFGQYPRWWTNLIQYQPLETERVDLDKEIGQKFGPTTSGRHGFNFADLSGTFDDFVSMPGTTYSTSDPVHGDASNMALSRNSTGLGGPFQRTQQQPQQAQLQQQSQLPSPPSHPPQTTTIPETLNIRVLLENYPGNQTRSSPSPNHRYSPSPNQRRGSPSISIQPRQRSLRRSRSRSGLKEYGALQQENNTLQEVPEKRSVIRSPSNRTPSSRNRYSYPASLPQGT